MSQTDQGGTRQDSHDWARRDQIGVVEAFLKTTSQLITEPATFFGKVSPTSPFQGSLFYGVLIGIVSVLFSAFWQLAVQVMGLGAAPEAFSQLVGLGAVLGMLVLSPVIVIVGIFLGAGILHLLLLMFGWNEHPFGATVKAVSFSGVSGLANAIPVCGGIIGTVWGIILLVVGLRELHGTSTGQAVVVVLAPVVLVLLCVCLTAGTVAMGTAM